MQLFKRNSSVTTTVTAAARADGYSAQQARIVALFQAAIERELSCACAEDQSAGYEALRASLLWARTDSVHKAITMITLRAQYNDYLYADSSIAYSTR